jgi:hypothetical protein
LIWTELQPLSVLVEKVFLPIWQKACASAWWLYTPPAQHWRRTMDELVEQALEAWAPLIESGYEVPAAGQVMRNAAAEIRSLRAEIERRKYDGVHTCHDQCQRVACVLRRENEALRAQVEQERAGIVAFLRREAARETPFGLDPMSALGLPLDYAAAMIERHEDKEPRA